MNLTELLKQEFSERQKRNSKYSLRAFARDLEMDPSHLSKVLAGKRAGSEAIVNRIARILAGQNSKLVPELDKVLSRTAEGKFRIKPGDSSYAELLQWENIAVLELLQVKRFSHSIAEIARVTQLSEAQVRASIATLRKLKLISKDESGSWIPNYAHLVAGEDMPQPHVADFDYYKQLMQNCTDSFGKTQREERLHLSMVLSLKKSRIPSVEKKAKAFRQALMRALDAGPAENDSVYAICISLHPLRKY